jgi:hypothetical protein
MARASADCRTPKGGRTRLKGHAGFRTGGRRLGFRSRWVCVAFPPDSGRPPLAAGTAHVADQCAPSRPDRHSPGEQLAHHAEPRAVLVEEPQVAVGSLAWLLAVTGSSQTRARRRLAVPISALRVPKNQGRMRAPTANEAHETRALTPGHRYSSLLTPAGGSGFEPSVPRQESGRCQVPAIRPRSVEH